MTAELAIFASVINRAWNSHDIEKVLSFYAPDFVGSDVGMARPLKGHADLRAMLENYWAAFPDLKFTITHTVVEGFRAALVWQAEGTHRGLIMNIPPTGRRVRVRGVSLIEVENGLVVRSQYIWDLAGMLRNMGLLPEL